MADNLSIEVRSRIDLPKKFEAAVPTRLALHVGHLARLIDHGVVRFEDLNGPKGGVDTACRIELVLHALPTVFVEKRAAGAGEAFAAALHAIDNVLQRTQRKHDRSAGRGKGGSGKAGVPAPRRTSRNELGKTTKATVALEDSATTPSRKSTRGSSNRGKASQGKERTALAKSLTPSANAARATAKRR
jgi:hypothetical protein